MKLMIKNSDVETLVLALQSAWVALHTEAQKEKQAKYKKQKAEDLKRLEDFMHLLEELIGRT